MASSAQILLPREFGGFDEPARGGDNWGLGSEPGCAAADHELVACASAVRDLWSDAEHQYARLADLRVDLSEPGKVTLPTIVVRSNETEAILRRIRVRRVAGLILSQLCTAKEQNIRLVLEQGSRLSRLPDSLNETAAVSVIGNLVQNAFDAVASVRLERRLVTCLLSDDAQQMRVRVRDWGLGLAGLSDEALLSHGVSTKAGHPGVGLALVSRLVRKAGGTLEVVRLDVGAAFEVVIPND